MPTADVERSPRGAALRVTRPRTAVLSAVHHEPHADTGPIIAAVREDLGEVSHQPGYDAHSSARRRAPRVVGADLGPVL